MYEYNNVEYKFYPAGIASYSASSSSLICPAGTYTEYNSEKCCNKCLTTMYSDITGAISSNPCKYCPIEEFTWNNGDSSCSLYRAGTFSNETNRSWTICPTEYYSSTTGQTNCTLWS